MDNQPVGCAGHRRRQRHVAFVLPLRGTKHPHLARLGARTHPHTHRTTRSTSGSGQGALQSWPNVDPGTDRGARPSQCHSKFLQDVKGLNPCEVPYNVKIVELPQEYPYLRKGPLPARIPRNPALGVPRGAKGSHFCRFIALHLQVRKARVMRTQLDTVTSDTTPYSNQETPPSPPGARSCCTFPTDTTSSVDDLSWQMVQNSFCLLLAKRACKLLKLQSMHGHLCLCLNHGKFLGMFGAGSLDDLLQLLHAVAPRHQLACAKILKSQCPVLSLYKGTK